MKKTLLAFFLCAICFGVQSQTLIKGVIIDSLTNESIPYATIRLARAETPQEIVKADVSDQQGKFNIKTNEQGEFLMTIQFIGKRLISQSILLGKEKTLDLGTITMNDDNELAEITVTASKPLVSIDLDKIVYSMESDPEAKTQNALEMLKKVPLITIDGEENIQLKGSSSFKVYLNGKPSNMISNNPKDVLKSMPANTIKNIEVITDPGAKYDAEGVTGIINIITNTNKMGGYTATLNGRVNSKGTFGGGGYLTMKYGRVGFTGNYNYYNYNNPKTKSSSYRENFTDPTNKYLIESGKNKNSGDGQYGSGELSFELDTFRLINFSFNRYYGKNKTKNHQLVQMQDDVRTDVYSYQQQLNSKNTYGSTDINLDYQRTFMKKDRLLTASYRLSLSPNDSESDSEIRDAINFANSQRDEHSDADMQEHTFQLDYTTPIHKYHTIEVGVKYILRENKSNSGKQTFDPLNNLWTDINDFSDKFKHNQNIFSGYVGYNLRYNSLGFKAGTRYEYTDLNVKYPLDKTNNFDTDYSNLVPSATASYQLNQTQTIRVGYNMRINRPSIWQLNPYTNTSNPNFISSGNPDLDAVKAHSFTLNYNLFVNKISINLDASYSIINNSIESLTTLVDGVSYTTYENIGKNKRFFLSSYINWTPISKLRVIGNLGLSYMNLKANNGSGLSNSRVSPMLYTSTQYTLPYNLKANVYGGYFGERPTLEGKSSSYSFHGISINKSFKNDKLTFGIYADNPFVKDLKFKSWKETDAYTFRDSQAYRSRGFGLNVSYRFGEMKQQIKKAIRTISNDDSLGSGQSQGGQGGQGGQN